MEIELGRGYKAVIDDEDFDLVSQFMWRVTKGKSAFYARGYRYVDGKRISFRMHRLITQAKHGETVDHIDHDTLNNRRSNLRICSNAENCRNKRVRSDSRTGVKNVMIESCGNGQTRIRAVVVVDGKRHRSCFKSIEAASAWAAEMRSKLHGEFAYQADQDKGLREILRCS